MKYYSKQSVLDASLDRIRRLYDEFPNIIVGFSGGKDSTVVLNLCLQVAREKNRLPLTVMWIDQEAEWQGTVDYVTDVMYSPEVNPLWFQFEMRWYNNIDSQSKEIVIWDESKPHEWMRPKEDISIKENKYKNFGFQELFGHIVKEHYPDEPVCYMAGMRTQESPVRLLGLTQQLTYKDITWGKVLDKKLDHYTFYPIYDWGYSDVWKYIHDNDIKYNRVYDAMYQNGVNVTDMRISNLHHETAIKNLMLIQEIEPQTWNKITNRLTGANTIKHIKSNSFKCPKNLPYMFSYWKDYCYFLADSLITDKDLHERLMKKVHSLEKIYDGDNIKDLFYRKVVDTILSNDFDFTKLSNWMTGGPGFSYKRFKQGKYKREMLTDRAVFTDEELNILLEGIRNNEK